MNKQKNTAHLKFQQGAALLLMVAILVVGAAAVLVGSLNAPAINIARQQQTSAALAQAKDALIAYAVTDTNRPGEIPCPDVNGDGFSLPTDEYSGKNCVRLLGRLPWKTLRLPDLRDGSGEPLWYAVSDSFHANGSTPINSDTVGTLSVSGNQSINNVAAIIIAPGVPLCGQSHATNVVDQYLEAMTVYTATTAVVSSANNDCANTPYNDQLLAITASQILQPVEQRIAREVKICLDDYAVAKGGKYPWAVLPSSTYFTGKTDNKFGRVPYQPPIADNRVSNFIDALDNLQAKVNACIANDNNANALDNAGSTLADAAQALRAAQPTTPAIPYAVTSPGKTAGDRAQNHNMCDAIHDNPSSNSVQINLNSSANALTSALSGLIATTHSSQAIKCAALFAQDYWQDWRNMVFYQVDDRYTPTGTASGNGSLSINGAGNYRAIVLMGRSVFPPKMLPRNPATPSDYLESPNAHSASNLLSTFESYRPVDNKYQTTSNDLIMCLDGSAGNCK